MRRAAWWGGLALLVRPAYVATEYVVAAATTGGYSFVADTVSQLGEVGCTDGFCSPRHAVMNGSFIGFGLLLAAGGALSRREVGTVATGLLVVSGLSSVATGLAPLDQDSTLHALAATPLFVAQPLALLAVGHRLRRTSPRLARGLAVTGVLTGAAAVAFVTAGEESVVAGAWERLALWPVLGALAAVGWRSVRRGD